MNTKTMALSSIALCAALAQPAMAQDASSSATVSNDSGDIIVTAQRREQKLQDVPVAVTAFSSKQLDNLGVQRPEDLFGQTPGISSQHPAGVTGFPIFIIRGVSMLDFSYSSESSIAAYVDDIYMGNAALLAAPLFDLERVEVLRGPQGTLYGRNATGGLISFVTAKPTAELTGKAYAQYGNFNDVTVGGAISGPLTENIRARLAVNYNHNTGYQDNLARFNHRYGAIDDAIGIRGKIDADFGDAKVQLSAHYNNMKGQNDLRTLLGTRTNVAPYTGACAPAAVLANQCVNGSGFRDPNPKPTRGYSEVDLPTSLENAGGSLRIDLPLSDAFTLTSLTGYEWIVKHDALDIDAAAVSPIRYLDYFDIRHRQISQEVRLAGDIGRLQLQVGGYYYNDKRFYTTTLPFFPNPAGLGNWTDQKIWSAAGFAQGTYAVTDTFNLTGGIRYTRDHKEIVLAGVRNGVPFTRQGSSTLFTLRSQLNPHKVTWRVGADWHITPDTMLFATASSGYKLGGYNTTTVTSAASAGPVDSETINAYELGVKTTLFPGLTANVTGYYSKWKGIQATASVPVGNPPVLTSVYINIGEADIYGIEGELNYRTGDLNITASGSYNHNKLHSDKIFGGVPLDGKRLANTPRVNLAASFNWEPEIGGGNHAILAADVSYKSFVYFRPENPYFAKQPGYALVGGRIGIETAGGIRLEGYAKNLLNKQYFVSGTTTGDAQVYTWGMPRTYGIRMSASF